MRRLQLLLIVFSFFLLNLQMVRACSCAYIPTFCETITFGNDSVNANYIIAHVSVEEKFATGMKVKIRQVFFGQPESSIISIESGNGADCRRNTEQFTVGNQYLFAISGNSQYGYSISECGITVLDVTGGTIYGPIAPGIDQLPLTQLPQLDACGNLISVPLEGITVRPTLTSENIQIFFFSDAIGKFEYAMFDMSGREVIPYTTTELLHTSPITIPTSHYAAGCYAIVTRVNGIKKVFKVVIVN
jgi:hypothetical protein